MTDKEIFENTFGEKVEDPKWPLTPFGELLKSVVELPDYCKEKVSDGYHTFGDLYAHRNVLFVSLANVLGLFSKNVPMPDDAKDDIRTWKSRKHFDGTSLKGFFIAGIGTKAGSVLTYHLPNAYWDSLEAEKLKTAPEWDGHTPNDVLDRLASMFFKG